MHTQTYGANSEKATTCSRHPLRLALCNLYKCSRNGDVSISGDVLDLFIYKRKMNGSKLLNILI